MRDTYDMLLERLKRIVPSLCPLARRALLVALVSRCKPIPDERLKGRPPRDPKFWVATHLGISRQYVDYLMRTPGSNLSDNLTVEILKQLSVFPEFHRLEAVTQDVGAYQAEVSVSLQFATEGEGYEPYTIFAQTLGPLEVDLFYVPTIGSTTIEGHIRRAGMNTSEMMPPLSTKTGTTRYSRYWSHFLKIEPKDQKNGDD